MSTQVYADGVLVEEWDDQTRTYTDHTTDPPTTRPYTPEENAAADQRAIEDAVVDDLQRRVEIRVGADERPRPVDRPRPGVTMVAV